MRRGLYVIIKYEICASHVNLLRRTRTIAVTLLFEEVEKSVAHFFSRPFIWF